jgi:hypothetical protein
VRRLAFHNYKGPLTNLGMKIIKWDQEILEPYITKRDIGSYLD